MYCTVQIVYKMGLLEFIACFFQLRLSSVKSAMIFSFLKFNNLTSFNFENQLNYFQFIIYRLSMEMMIVMHIVCGMVFVRFKADIVFIVRTMEQHNR